MARGLFDIPDRPSKDATMKLARKSAAVQKSPSPRKSGGGLLDRINRAKALIESHFGNLAEQFKCIRDKEELMAFIDRVNAEGVCAIDTETSGLDPMKDNIVGISISTDTEDVYIPINHISYIDNVRIENQLKPEEVKECLEHLDRSVSIVWFNATFDIRFIMNHVGVRLWADWDCSIGSRIMNENEESRQLKPLHAKYCPEEGETAALTFSDIFEGMSFEKVPINIGYIYAANDSRITLRLYKFQKKHLFYEPDKPMSDRNGMNGVSWVFFNIEMPVIDVVTDMENAGIAFDLAYNAKLKEDYHAKLDKAIKDVYNAIEKYSNDISKYRTMNPGVKLDEPINVGSPKQLAVLLYDIMGVKSVDEKSPRGTGNKILKKINNEFTKALIEYRGFSKLVDTYIDKLPECVFTDGRIHGRFNQYGADTGRFSSKDPNLQNIPSHNKEIRKMFVASPGYALMSSDFSQQEPKCLAALCNKQGDSQMYDTLMAGKDLYSEIASKAFHKPYEECCEFAPDGSKNPAECKERRSQAKTVLLGVLYGLGIAGIAERLGCSVEEAKQIKESVFKGFPAIKRFEQDSIAMAEDLGYVTTVCGRKRRLPSMMLPDYEVEWIDGVAPDDDPLDFVEEAVTEVPEDVERKWLTRIRRANFKDRRKVIESAKEEGIKIIDHTREKDVTKVVNARIQGSAADLTKLAMIDLYNNKRLRELGFRLLIQVHDEVIAECPLENVRECTKLLADTMSGAAEKILEMPIKCDVEVSECWYGKTLEFEETEDEEVME